MRAWWSRLRAAFGGRKSIANDLEEEIDAHLEFETRENIARGMTPGAARQAARRGFGSVTATRESAREAWGFPAFDALRQDIRYGLRAIRGAPGISLVVILTVALGIGANTAIFSVVNTVLLKPLPYPDAERLVWLGEATARSSGISVTWINFRHWRSENHSFEAMAAFETAHLTLTGRDEPMLLRAALVTSELLPLIGRRTVIGRVFTEAEDRQGAPYTVVLSHKFWSEKFGGDPKVPGTTLALNGKQYQVIGVAAPGLEFFRVPIDCYVPLGLTKSDAQNRSQHGSMRLLARLKRGVTLAAAQADLDSIMQRLAGADPGPENDHRPAARYLEEFTTRDVRPTLLILMGSVGLVLLIACANVASLTLARSTTRAREIAVRAAIGAGRMRIVSQLLTESVVLAVLGGLSGLALAHWCLGALIRLGPQEIPRLAETALDIPVLLFASAITLITGLLAGLAPALQSRRLDLASALKDSSRSATGSKGSQKLRSTLVAGEIAITLMLAFTSGLLLRSLIAAQTADPGFRVDRLLALELVLPSSAYRGPAARAFYEKLAVDLQNLPGAAGVGLVNCAPSAGVCKDWFYSVLGRPAPSRGEVPLSVFNIADPAYFRVMGIPLREGRWFTEADGAGSPRVAIVNETIARQWWPGKPAVGERIKDGGPYIDGPTYEIVGVAGNVSQVGLDSQPMPEIYLPFAQVSAPAMTVMIRTAREPESLAAAVRKSVMDLDRNLPIQRLRAFDKSLAATLERRRFVSLLLGLFAGLAAMLATVGIYGLLSYWVSVREGEIAIRMALGAQRSTILRWVGSQAMRLAAAGIVFGGAAAWAASRWMEGFVFGVPARDPVTMIGAAVAVAGIVVLAAAAPAWRAARVGTVGRWRDG